MSSFRSNSGNRTAPIFITIVIVFLFLIIQGLTPACAGDVEKENNSSTEEKAVKEWDIVAEVDGKTISTGELLRQYNLNFLMSRFSRTYKKGVTVNTYLDHYISELLLLQKADDLGIRVGNDEVENEKKRFLKLYRFSEDTLLKWLNSKAMTIDDAVLYFKNKLMLKQLYRKIIGVKEISDEEARDYYKTHDDYYHRPEKIRASHILICHNESQGCKSNLSKTKAKELAESVRKSATPENFSTLAQRYSFDSTGKSGGSLGEIVKGTAVPSFEEAAFSLGKGEISDIAETAYGYHIIYVSDRLDELSISFEEARESIIYTLEDEQITSELLKYSEELKKEAKIKKYTDADRKSSVSKSRDQVNKEKTQPPVKQYSTFKATGNDLYKNDKGQPVIILFTRVGCHFCEWVEETFEEVVAEYVEKGLIEAHHYDFNTKDDFLTPQVETSIPQDYIKQFEFNNPNSSTPYFSFGGMYYRRGTGYFDQDDLYAEEMEMKQIIDDLLRE